MTVAPAPTALRQLADTLGVVDRYVDGLGRARDVGPDAMLAVTSMLYEGPLETERQIRAALVDMQGRERDRSVEPVIVAWDGCMPREEDHGSVVLESGEEVPLGGEARLPFGYHRRHVGDDEGLVIAAPTQAHPLPGAVLGLFTPIYALRRRHADPGIGTLADLDALLAALAPAGVQLVSLLPLLATFADQPSPYAPASRQAWNDLIVDLNDVHVSAPADSSLIDYPSITTQVNAQLHAYAADVRSDERRRAAVDAWADARPDRRPYATFRAVVDELGRNWRAWPEPWRSGDLTGAPAAPERIDRYVVGQWLADTQLRGIAAEAGARNQLIGLDLPVGCNADGFDIWAHQELYTPASLGAPPDRLFANGQGWGLPAVHPERSRAAGHHWLRDSLRHQLPVAGLLRIDHVMGLRRTWWVPPGAAPADGAYVRQHTEELLAIICLESVRHQAVIVGENLGTVPPATNDDLRRHRISGMRVVQDGGLEPRAGDVASLNTHDMPPFAAWWDGLDIDDLADLGVFDDDVAARARQERRAAVARLEARHTTKGVKQTRDALHAELAASPAGGLLVNLEDMWLETRRQNVPGTDAERANWRLRNVPTVEDMAEDGGLLSEIAELAGLRSEHGV